MSVEMNSKHKINEVVMNVFIDKFEDSSCRSGGEHQWFGDGIVSFSDGKTMNKRKFDLLSKPMQDEYDVIGSECTCNKCGVTYTETFNVNFIS